MINIRTKGGKYGSLIVMLINMDIMELGQRFEKMIRIFKSAESVITNKVCCISDYFPDYEQYFYGKTNIKINNDMITKLIIYELCNYRSNLQKQVLEFSKKLKKVELTLSRTIHYRCDNCQLWLKKDDHYVQCNEIMCNIVICPLCVFYPNSRIISFCKQKNNNCKNYYVCFNCSNKKENSGSCNKCHRQSY